MQVKVDIIGNGKLVFVQFRGKQTAQVALKGMEDVRNLPGYQDGLPELVDLSGISETNIDFDGMRRISHEAGSKGVSATRKKLIAIHAPQDTSYGMARMFATLAELHRGNIRAAAFRCEAESLAWLGRPEKQFLDVPGFAIVAQGQKTP